MLYIAVVLPPHEGRIARPCQRPNVPFRGLSTWSTFILEDSISDTVRNRRLFRITVCSQLLVIRGTLMCTFAYTIWWGALLGPHRFEVYLIYPLDMGLVPVLRCLWRRWFLMPNSDFLTLMRVRSSLKWYWITILVKYFSWLKLDFMILVIFSWFFTWFEIECWFSFDPEG